MDEKERKIAAIAIEISAEDAVFFQPCKAEPAMQFPFR